MRGMLSIAVVAAWSLMCPVALAAPGPAAVYAANGERCTSVGTRGADRLTGTDRHDVLCGLGGNDVVVARAGDDTIDAGLGDDEVDAGGGADLVFGQAGDDQVTGGTGSYADQVHGGPGADSLNGGTGADQVWGDAGPDHVGGGSGSDVLYGGLDGDSLAGDGGDDQLLGQTGDDELSGGSGADQIDGGDGTNWCTLDSLDVPSNCATDEQPPSTGTLRLSTTSVNVTNKDQLVGISVHLTDDTGIRMVQLFAGDNAGHRLSVSFPNLKRGTVRDGVWKVNMIVPRWSDPGPVDIDVSATDRVGRYTDRRYRNVLRVIDRNPDTEMPTVRLLQPTGDATFNVRRSAQRVTIEARITDAESGVRNGGAFCLYAPLEGGYSNLQCGLVDLVSGNRNNGIWRSHVTIPKGFVGGDWNVGIGITDNAHSGNKDFWMGPDLYRQRTNDGANVDPSYHLFPNGRGRFSVLGSTDSTPPEVSSAEVTPTEVDTLGGDASVHFQVHAVDAPGEGVTGVSAELRGDPDAGAVEFVGSADLRLATGTKVDGIWEGDLTIPQGVPPGTYYPVVYVGDLTHLRHYAPAGTPMADQPDTLILTGDPHVTVIDHPAS